MIYVNCDASYRDGWAGIAYQSDHLESQSQLIECKHNVEAELRALLLAMRAAEQANVRDVVFRTDCESTAQPHRGNSECLRPLRAEVCLYLARHQPGWAMLQISRAENALAHGLARKARLARSDVTVTVDSHIAAALIEHAGIPETPQGRWQLSPDRRSNSQSAALAAALTLIAKDARPTPRPAAEVQV